ncbi:MAG: hypothetical protein GY832_03890 [Chloroflexi bacterium]|nr:hypothetical protein [Chloroflexota bacterium]
MNDTRPPAILSEYWRFQRYGLPPNAGGQRDQPVRWFDNAHVLDTVYRAFALYKQRVPGKEAAWYKAHPAEARIIGKLRELVWA